MPICFNNETSPNVLLILRIKDIALIHVPCHKDYNVSFRENNEKQYEAVLVLMI